MGQNDMFGGRRRMRPPSCCPSRAMAAGRAAAARIRRHRLLPSAIRSTITRPPLKRLRVQFVAEFSRAVKDGCHRGQGRRDRGVADGTAHQTGTRWAIIGLSDPTGHFEAVLFFEVSRSIATSSSPGPPVLLQLGAELQGEDVRRPASCTPEPLDAAAAKTQKGLRIFLRDTSRGSIVRRLQGPGSGPQGGCGARASGEATNRGRRKRPMASVRWC